MSIVKMYTLELVTVAGEKERILSALQDCGCVELRDAPMETEEDEVCRADTGKLKVQQSALAGAIHMLEKMGGKKTTMLAPKPDMSVGELLDEKALNFALDAAQQIHALSQRMSAANNEKNSRETEIKKLKHWEKVEINLGQTQTKHTLVHLGTIPADRSFDGLAEELRLTAPLSELYKVSQDKESIFLVAVCHKSENSIAAERLSESGFAAIKDFPQGTAAENISKNEQRIQRIDGDIDKLNTMLLEYIPSLNLLEMGLDRLEQKINREQAKDKLATNGSAVWLRGWVPHNRMKKLQRVLDSHLCAFTFKEVEAEEIPPTLLENPKWMRPINVVTEMYSLPDYRGIDPNPLIFFFYIFYFGFMFADVAYGLVLLAISTIILKKIRPTGTFGQLMGLGQYLGISTFLCGIFTGGFFGDAAIVVAETFLHIPYDRLPAWLVAFSNGLVFNPLKSPMAVLYTAIAIGVFQLVFGQCVHIYMEAKNGRIGEGLLDTVPWWILFLGIAAYFLAGNYVWILVGVVALIATQGRHKKGAFGKLFGGVTSLYGITGWLSDVLSYSRLMALMLATSVIASVVNTLGALPGSILAFIPIFIIGHAFNIAVNLIGTFVHAARLQYLEFYGKFFKEGGLPFRPLCYKTKYVNVKKENE